VYLSSTGVYGRGDGAWVDEDTPVADETPRARGRLAAERARFATCAAPAVALRIAAIYGPGRGIHTRLRRGDHAVIDDGDNWVSRIHVDDLVSVILAAAAAGAPPARNVYLVADDEPATARAHADGVAAMMGLPPPPSVSIAEIAAHELDLRMSNRRVRNDRMKRELGVTLRYPTWREGVRACLDEEAGREPQPSP
jgi:nucleoside-diphosphate-sugar epimerase